MCLTNYIKTPQHGIDPDLPPGALNLDRVLFLDVDGVLHPESCDSDMMFCFMTNFCEVLRVVDPAGEMPIVISSMWKFDTPMKELRAHFPADIGRQLIGVTPDLPGSPSPGWGGAILPSKLGQRQREVEAWMQAYSPCGEWLAIDDRASWFSGGCPNLFLVPGLYEDEGGGINTTVAIDLQERLQSFLGLRANQEQAQDKQAPK